jgi:hypothetical protein
MVIYSDHPCHEETNGADMKFNQMAEALAKVRLSAKDVQEASPRLVEDPVATGPDVSVREVCPAIGDNNATKSCDVRRLSMARAETPRKVNGVIVGESHRDITWMKLGDVAQISLCPTSFWDEEIAKMRAVILKKTFIREGRDRILLLGARVAKIWLVGGRSRFGLCTLLIDSVRLNVAWIPHPKKLTEYTEQLEATTYIEWVCGERKMP